MGSGGLPYGRDRMVKAGGRCLRQLDERLNSVMPKHQRSHFAGSAYAEVLDPLWGWRKRIEVAGAAATSVVLNSGVSGWRNVAGAAIEKPGFGRPNAPGSVARSVGCRIVAILGRHLPQCRHRADGSARGGPPGAVREEAPLFSSRNCIPRWPKVRIRSRSCHPSSTKTSPHRPVRGLEKGELGCTVWVFYRFYRIVA